jgi:hypothetical protein
MVMLVNNGFEARRNIMLVIRTYDMNGKDSLITQVFTFIEPSSVKKILPVNEALEKMGKERGIFLSLQLLDENKEMLSDNFYWFADAEGKYSGLQSIAKSSAKITAKKVSDGKIEVMISNPAANPVAFFNRIALTDAQTGKRILPAFYSDNYISVVPGGEKKIMIDYPVSAAKGKVMIAAEGWNVAEQFVSVQ